MHTAPATVTHLVTCHENKGNRILLLEAFFLFPFPFFIMKVELDPESQKIGSVSL
jgi:hypothetical protein